MDGLYLPDGRQLALIDRDWILDELPHLGNPDSNSDANYLLASAAAAANCCSGTGSDSSTARTTSTLGTGSGATHVTSPNPVSGASRGTDLTGVNHHTTSATSYTHNLAPNSDEFESDLTLLSEIIDETQNKWSDFGLNQLLTPYIRSNRPLFK